MRSSDDDDEAIHAKLRTGGSVSDPTIRAIGLALSICSGLPAQSRVQVTIVVSGANVSCVYTWQLAMPM
jgi:hypothetical protein